jgi:hypothetical protein
MIEINVIFDCNFVINENPNISMINNLVEFGLISIT